jgi:phosphoglycerate dehydrogenase-like enzyme
MSVPARRFAGLLAMSPDVVPAAFPPRVMARLLRTVDLVSAAPVTDFTAPPTPAALARTEVIISGWGCPPIDEAVLDAAPRLRAVIHAAGTVKGHVSPLAWDRGVLVSSAAAVNAVPVAQYTLAMILLAGKRVFQMAREYPLHPPGTDKSGRLMGNHDRTVGVIGASRVGRLVLPLLAEQGFRTLVSDPTLDERAAARLTPRGGTRLVELETLLRESDVVSVHAPLLPSTRNMIDESRLALMPDGATLVNTARGGLVDSEALTRECVSGRINAVLDVTEPEPLPSGHPLLHLPNVLVTPHIAGALGNEVSLLGLHAAEEVERLAEGAPLLGPVPKHELEHLA